MIFAPPRFAQPLAATTGDESEIDLPPMDGGADDSPADSGDNEELDPVPEDAADDPFDDATGTDDPVDPDELDAADDVGDGGDEDRERDLDDEAEFLEDRGSAPSLESESMLAENDELGVGDEDFGIREELGGVSDAGEEGPRDADEELREEDLPALDADDLGDGDDSDFFELDGSEPPPFVWSDARWRGHTVGAIGGVLALVCVGDGAVAMGADPPRLWQIGEERAELLGAEGAPREGWRALRGNRRGELTLETDTGFFSSHDGGRHFEQQSKPAEPAGHPLLDMQRELDARGVDLRGYKLTAAAIIDEMGTLLAAVSRTRDGGARGWLVRIPPNGAALTVGVVRGLVWEVVWEESRGRAWVASDEGVTTFTPAERV